MPPMLVLPTLDSQANIPVGPAGQWQSARLEDLERIGTNLDRGSDAASSLEVMSIPDVWAQPETFRFALSDDRSPLHGACVAEWRGMLAMLGLASAYGLRPIISRVNLAGRSQAVSILGRVPPTARLSGPRPWDAVSTITLDGQPIGLHVPSILVCPGKSTPRALPGVPWYRNGRFSDPTSDAQLLTDEDLLILRAYLRTLREELPQGDTPLYRTIIAQVVDFLGEVEDLLRARETISRHGEEPQFLRRLLDGQVVEEALRPLLAQFSLQGGGARLRTDTLIPLRPAVAADHGLNGLILVDPRMAEGTDRQHQIMIWGNKSLAVCLRDAESFNEVKREAARRGYVVCMANDLFSDYLCKLGTGEFPAHEETAFRNYLLPLSPLALLIQDNEEIERHLEFAGQNAAQNTVIKLTVPLVSTESRTGGGQYVVVREYGRSELVNSEPSAALSRWPDFHSTGWGLYLTYHSTMADRFAIRAVLSDGALRSFLQTVGSDQMPVDLPRRILGSLDTDRETICWKRELAQREIWSSSEPPKALSCYLPDRNGSERPVGLVLLPAGNARENRPANGPVDWQVGIDFGTTKTMVYRRIANGNPEPMQFKGRVLNAIRWLGDDETTGTALEEFFPPTPVNLPVMTALRLRPESARKVAKVMRAAAIFHIPDINRAVSEFHNPNVNQLLRTDLKWRTHDAVENREGGADENNLYVQYFLEQLLLQTLAEAFDSGVMPDRVRCFFSHPEAFDRRQLRGFKSACAGAIKQITGEATPGANLPPHAFKTENVAAALYFHHKMRVPLANPTITIDIGGRTSDISIWSEHRLIWKNSVEFAGQHILTDFLLGNESIIDEFIEKIIRDQSVRKNFAGAIKQIHQISKESDKKFSLEILLGITDFGRVYLDDIQLAAGSPLVSRLIGITSLSLAGLLYYVMGVLSYLRTTELIKTKAHNSRVNICLGGRVADLFKKLVPLNEEGGIVPFLKEAASGGFQDVDVIFSKAPKHEVSYGLIADEVALGIGNERIDHRIRPQSTAIIPGEVMMIDEQKKEALLPITDAELKRALRVSNDLPRLKALLTLLRTSMGVHVEWSPHLAGSLADKVNDKLVQEQRRMENAAAAIIKNDDSTDPATKDADTTTEEATDVEPIFIPLLRELVHRLTSGDAQISLR